MKRKPIYLLISMLLATEALAAQIPVIRATSELVNIRDGADFEEGNWTIVPEARPDVYTTPNKGKIVTFYTDKDSISWRVEAEQPFDFIILLNGKDSAYTQIRYQPSYLDVLKSAATYNPADNSPIPDFSYQSPNDPNLLALRKGFNLDSIAGTGNEISQILNLLHWIHRLIPHDGNHENPAVKNAMSMIATCKKDNRGLNCRGLATVLNECYLSMGFKSRIVTCMPKDSVFDDCHVINIVYSNDLEKWVWVDPTNDAYIMDAQGTLQSIEEVRAKVISGEMLIVNPDANWNNKSSTLKEFYLYQYMAKNLYRLECPLRSEYDFETWTKGKTAVYVELLPLDGYRQEPKHSQNANSKLGVNFETYKTNNPAVFWAKPKD